MSGFLSTIVNGAVTFGESILFGAFAPVILGDFIFETWEIPERVTWGGDQRMTVHKFPGGKRDIDAMGYDESPIAWGGIFLGPFASFRAAQLNQIRVDGFPVPLIFGGRFYTVVVEHFTAEQMKLYHLRYQITCVAVTDAPEGLQTDPTALDQSQADSTQTTTTLTNAPAPAAKFGASSQRFQSVSQAQPSLGSLVPQQAPLNTFIEPVVGQRDL